MKVNPSRRFFFVLFFLSISTLILSPSATAETVACVTPPTNMLAWWPGDGSAVDIINNHDGTISGGVTYPSGKVNTSFSFDGIDDYVQVLDLVPSENLDGLPQISIEAWINPDTQLWVNPNTGGYTNAIVSKYDSTQSSGASYYLNLENGKLRMAVFQSVSPVSWVGFESTSTIAVGSWSHVAGVWHGGTDIRLYVNGAQVTGSLLSQGSTPSSMANNVTALNIGRIESFGGTFVGPGAYFHGLVDELAIYDRALSPTEIANIFGAGISGKCSSTNGNFIFLPVIVKPPKLLKNGNFENGPVSWGQYSSNGWQLILNQSYLPLATHGGQWAAWMGGDVNEDSLLWQEVTVPQSNPTLTIWHWIASEDACGYDVAGVSVNATEVVDAFWLCDDNDTHGWVKKNFDLSSYSGQTVEIDIAAFTDETLNSNWFIDDVSLGGVSISSGVREENDQVAVQSEVQKSVELIRTEGSIGSNPSTREPIVTPMLRKMLVESFDYD